jgi:hypothetical protein
VNSYYDWFRDEPSIFNGSTKAFASVRFYIHLVVCFRANRKEIYERYLLPPFAGNVVSFHGFEKAELGRGSTQDRAKIFC